MTKENPVYFKLEYSESIESKKDILSTEVSLLNLIKYLKRYNSLRTEEFKVKSQIYGAIKKMNLNMRKTQSSFPFLKIPNVIKRDNITKKEIPKEKFDQDLESELREIQNRLASLG